MSNTDKSKGSGIAGDGKSQTPTSVSIQDLLAMELARDGKAVNLLAEQVLNEARKTVFGELRSIAIVTASILSILGISTWWSLDDKVKSHVGTAVSASLKERSDQIQKGQNDWFLSLGELQQKTKDIETQAKEISGVLELAKQRTVVLNEESENALTEIRNELRVVKAESRKTQTYLFAIRSGPPTDVTSDPADVQLFFGELPEHAYAIAGSSNFGMGSEDASGGRFTSALIEAMDKAADTNHDGLVSLSEIAIACRSFAGQQKPVFGGNDVPLLVVKDGPNQMPPNRKLHALIVGINSVDPKAYDGFEGVLTGPEKDVDRMKRQLENKERVLASGISINILKTKEATRSKIIEGIKAIGSQTSKEDIVVFYYSGHGAKLPDTGSPDGVTKSFVAYDGMIEMSEVLVLLHKIEAYRVVLVIDA